MKTIKLFIIALCLTTSVAHAQSEARDGTWINARILAADRLSARTSTQEDMLAFTELVYFTNGVLAVHSENNFYYSLFSDAHIKQSGPIEKMSKSDLHTLRVASSFAPLLAMPEAMSNVQVIAILRRYLANNPEKWNLQASILIRMAFEDAYSKKKLK